MWAGVFPAVTTKFTKDDKLDHAEMERCFALQMDAGCDGIIVAVRSAKARCCRMTRSSTCSRPPERSPARSRCC
jgi:hypothetical protein